MPSRPLKETKGCYLWIYI